MIAEDEIRGCHQRPFAIGMPVAARYLSDSIWYRAVIIDMESHERGGHIICGDGFCEPASSPRYLVLHVDFGSREWIGNDDILPLADEFLDFPRETVCCCLANVRPCPAVARANGEK